MQLPTEMSNRGKQNLTAITAAKEVDNLAPANWNQPEQPETLSDLQITPAKSLNDQMRRDPAFRYYIEEHQ